MKKLSISDTIESGKPTLIYFSGENCSVCKSLKPKIFAQVSKTFSSMNLFEIKIEEQKELISEYSVFSIPTILVFFDKKEFLREGRNLSISEFLQKIQRLYELKADK